MPRSTFRRFRCPGLASRSKLSAVIHRFGNYELDEAKGELRCEGKPVRMQPKPYELLRLLLRERERVVSFDELHEGLWPDTIVTPSSLTRAVSHARRAIGDTGRGEIIRSHARRGYRFCADVESHVPAPGVPDAAKAGAEAVPAGTPRDPFVGREAALAQLDAAWGQAAAGRGGVAVLRGPAGIGKSRLAQEFARRAGARGARVIVAHGRQGAGVPPLWIWTPVLRELGRHPQFADALVPVLEYGKEFARWVPELTDRIAEARRGKEAEVERLSKEERQFLLFDAAGRSLFECSRREALLVVLEDLHWSSAAALGLLEHVALGVGGCRALLLATVRDEAEPNPALRRTLAGLKGVDGNLEVPLDGLSRGEVASLLAEAIGRHPPSELSSEVFARTEGVPLFVREAIRLLATRGDLADPEALSRRGVALPLHSFELIHRSLDALPSDAVELVSVGAALGRDFSVPLVASIAEVDRETALSRIDVAVAGGVLEPAAEDPGRFRFAHALFRDAAYERLGPHQRVRLHHRVAERLEPRLVADPGEVLPELSYHLHRSLALGDPGHALEIAERAATQARALGADDQAAQHYEQALAALEHRDPPDADRRLALLIELAEAHGFAGERGARRERAEQAMDLARSLERPREFARAAIAFCEITEWSPVDPEAARALHEALELLGDVASVQRAKILVRLSYLEAGSKHLEVGADRAAVEARGREALAAARKTGDADAIQEALFTLMYILAGPDQLGERASLASELADLAPDSGDRDPALVALIDSACDALAEGSAAAAGRRRNRAEALCGTRPHQGFAWHLAIYDAGIALMEGRLSEGLGLTEHAVELGRRISHPYANACWLAQRAEAARWQGRAGESLRLLERGVDASAQPNHWILGVCGRCHLSLGNETRARDYFERIAVDAFSRVPRGIRWLNSILEAAHLCVELGEDGHADPLIELLSPVSTLHGVFCIPVNYGGPIAGALAGLHALRGETDAAIGFARSAVASTAALGARPQEMRHRRDLASLLVQAGDAAEAADERAAADRIASECGLEDALRPGA